ncbi:MAG: glutamyl-tRNA(Gln) amidotransferase subunit A [Melioribacteraceae bacterium]|nr:MAG: glutamyl-tRNA(Gln) amidotransferase subunit A [Melioribacteraceae bacterium]
MVSYSNFSEKLALIKSGRLTLSENVDFFLQKIRDNSDLNAYNFVFEDAAKKRALEVEAKIKSGNFGKLAGLVVAIKDVLSLKDNPLTCSSKILKDFEAVYTATAVQKLLDEDAIIIGKTNCDEFAMGSSNENSAFGPALNPVDKDYVPGGSSGGSAVAVAAGLCDVSLGTDTGGSIRQPASYCGIVGMKPTYGLVSRFGLTAFASSFDTIGPFANNVEDAELLLSVIAGFDENDSTSVEHQYTPDEKNLDEIVIGLPKEYFGEGTDEEVNKSLQEAISTLKNNGVKFKEISLPHTEYTIATYYILTTAEASSNLSRYDGARYGYRSENVADLAEMYENSRSEGFGDEVKRRIMLGTYVLSAGYYDAYYLKAQKVRRLIREDFDKAFEEVDFILTPTTPGTAFKLGENIDDPLKMYMLDIFTTSANLAGIPGISLPVKNVTGKMPVGLQLFGNRLSDAGLFAAAKQIFSLL